MLKQHGTHLTSFGVFHPGINEISNFQELACSNPHDAAYISLHAGSSILQLHAMHSNHGADLA